MSISTIRSSITGGGRGGSSATGSGLSLINRRGGGGSSNRLSLRSSLSEDTARQYIQRLAILYDDEHHHPHPMGDDNNNGKDGDNKQADGGEEDDNDCDCDKKRLRIALEEAGRYANGIGAVEIYRYRERLGDLVWLDMWNRNAGADSCCNEKDKLSKEDDDNDEEEVKPTKNDDPPPKKKNNKKRMKVDPVLPGTGLVGTIWSQLTSTKKQQQQQQSSTVNRSTAEEGGGGGGTNDDGDRSQRQTTNNSITIGGGGPADEDAEEAQPTATTVIGTDDNDDSKKSATAVVSPTANGKSRNAGGLQWRDLESIQIDPDTWQCHRIQEHLQVGLTKAAGVCFDCDGIKGIVIYYASDAQQQQQRQQQPLQEQPTNRSSSSSNKKKSKDGLNTITNTIYLKRCASYMGSILAMSEARKACVCYQEHHQQQQQQKETIDEESPPSKHLSPVLVEAGSNDIAGGDGVDASSSSDCLDKFQTRFVAWYNKCWGGGLQIPPPMELQQVAWTWLGAFVGLLVLSTLNELFVHLSDNEYNLVIGPFGAMMTLLYALPGAPASQPRNVILGETIAGFVSMSLSYIPIPKWARRAVTPAFGIAAMTACGVVHPPAGAHATIWADREHNWGFYALVVFCSAVSVIPATVINNMSVKRRYPTYWGYLPKWLYYKVFGHDDDDDVDKQS